MVAVTNTFADDGCCLCVWLFFLFFFVFSFLGQPQEPTPHLVLREESHNIVARFEIWDFPGDYDTTGDNDRASFAVKEIGS